MHQRSEVPRKTTMCHLQFFTLWLKCLKGEHCRRKRHRACRSAFITVSASPSLLLRLLARTSSPTPTTTLFQISDCLTSIVTVPGSIARRKLSWISAPLRQNYQGTWGQHCQHTCHRAASEASPHTRGRAVMLPQLSIDTTALVST